MEVEGWAGVGWRDQATAVVGAECQETGAAGMGS